jgi:hypothetical protein
MNEKLAIISMVRNIEIRLYSEIIQDASISSSIELKKKDICRCRGRMIKLNQSLHCQGALFALSALASRGNGWPKIPCYSTRDSADA